MPIKRASWPQGRVVALEHTSEVLVGNPLGDPHVRPLHVWLPPGYDDPERSAERYPVAFDLVGYTGTGMSHTNWKNFGENVPERAARLMQEGKIGPLVVVFPDCFTALGGNQYINSSAIGLYADYLTQELVPFVDARFRTLASREHRGCFGKSSGGYGAIVHAMKYPQYWGALADHSGDAYFDFVYRSDWPNTLRELEKYAQPKRRAGATDVVDLEKNCADGLDDGRVKGFLDAFWSKPKTSSAEGHVLMNLCMAASYDPDPQAPNGFRLPFNLETGELIEERWAEWLKHDPIHMIDRYADALRSSKGIYIDCGWADQYHIQYGSRIVSKRLARLGIGHVYEEFDDNHSDIDYRMDVSLPFLYNALKA